MENSSESTEQTSQEDSQQTNQESQGSDQANTGSQSYEVNGQQMSAEQLRESYLNLQKDYTKKTQELSGLRGQQSGESSQSEDEAVEQLADLLAPAFERKGYIKADQAVTKDELRLQNILDRNPDLKAREQEIKDLSSLPHNKGKAYEDIIAQYGFASKDKMDKARQSDLVGNRINSELSENKELKDKQDMAVKRALEGGSLLLKR